MNLKKGSSHDFDLLAENKGLALGDSENLTLVLQKFEPYPITVIITPTLEGKARIEVYFRKLEQTMVFEWSLGVPRKAELALEMALGILREHEDLTIEIPLVRLVEQVMDMTMPIQAKIAKLKIMVSNAGETQFSVAFEGKPEAKAETLEELRKLLQEGD